MTPQIQTLYERRTELEIQYRELAKVQKVACMFLTDKSKELLLADPHYHETLPEYKIVMNQLQEIYEENNRKIEAKKKLEMDFLQRKLKQDEDYENRRFLVSLLQISLMNLL